MTDPSLVRAYLRPAGLAALFGALLFFALEVAPAISAQLAGVGGRYWGRRVTVSTSACVQDTTDAGSACVLFPAGQARWSRYNLTVLEAGATLGAGVTCCYTQTATGATIGSGWITADVRTGAGAAACVELQAAGDREQQRPVATDVRARPGGRPGLCAGSVLSGSDRLFPPCSNTSLSNAAECTALGLSGAGARCVPEAEWTADQRDLAGVYLVCAADSGSQPIHVSKERVAEF
jgi:hypothetical protein